MVPFFSRNEHPVGSLTTNMATIKAKFIEEQDLTIFTVEGDLLADEIIKYSSEYYESKPTKCVLWDATKGSVRNIKPDDFRRIAFAMKTYTHKRSGGKTALVGNFEIDFGFSRMYQAYAEIEKLPIAYQAFRNIDEALAWLSE